MLVQGRARAGQAGQEGWQHTNLTPMQPHQHGVLHNSQVTSHGMLNMHVFESGLMHASHFLHDADRGWSVGCLHMCLGCSLGHQWQQHQQPLEAAGAAAGGALGLPLW